MQAKREYILAGLVSIISFVVYLKSLAPSVFWWDSGEFIANAAVLGIPHRPGFPLYILLARIFSLFGAGNISWYVNLFSALAASLSLFFIYLIFVRITTDRYTSKSNKLFTELVGLGVVLILGFNYSFWIQAVRAEVYSLAFLLFSLQLWLVITNETGVKWSQKAQFLFFFITGLSLTNHPAIALSTLPALLYLHMTKTSQPWKPANLFFSFLLFMLGISVYWYLPIRSSQEPVLNWLNPSDWEGYLKAIVARDSLGQIQHFNQGLILQNLFGISKLFLKELGVLSILLAMLGFWSLGPKKRRWLWLALLLILFNCLALAFLTDQFIADNPDLHGYLLPSLFVFCLAFGWGCYFLLNRTFLFFSQKAFGPALKYAVATLGVIFVMFISAIPWFQSKDSCNLAANPLPETYARQAVTDLEDSAVVVIDNPNLDFLLRGLQYGENFRKDLIVIDRALLPARWYCDQLRHNFPGLFAGIPANLTGEKLAMTLAMQNLNQTLPVYWEFSDRDSALSPYLLPSGYLCQIVRNAGEFNEQWVRQAQWESENLGWDTTASFKLDGDAQRVWSLVMFNLGCFYESVGLLAQAKDKYDKILTLSPDEDIVSARLKTVEEAILRAQN